VNDLQYVKGGAELNRFLQELPVKLEKNILRGALRAGANVVAPEVARNAPKATGELAMGVKVSTNSRAGRVMAKIKLTGKHAFLGRWFEFTGVKVHAIKAKAGGFLFFGGLFVKSALHPGFAARPFMRPALDAQAQPATATIAAYIKSRLTKQGLDTADVEIDEP
jgi:HK97 gp10 family phage protein